ncbi:MAG: 4-hydroxy-tetrahydrodipicolinate reductase [Pseudomonadota bacterium]
MPTPTAPTAFPVVITGASGRMGRAVGARALANPAITVAAAIDRADSPVLGADFGSLSGGDPCGVSVGSDLPTALSVGTGSDAGSTMSGGPLVVIDFSTPAASLQTLAHAVTHNCALVVGTTGFTPPDDAQFAEAARNIPIVKSGNMSTGIAILSALVAQAARHLPDFDVEITEAHHRHKIDAPSGTALMLGEAAAQGRGRDLVDLRTGPRDGITGAREEGSIGFSVVRGGGIVGDHAVMLASATETLTLSHHAIDRSLFADGALRAAAWLGESPREPGLYTMADVLGL